MGAESECTRGVPGSSLPGAVFLAQGLARRCPVLESVQPDTGEEEISQFECGMHNLGGNLVVTAIGDRWRSNVE